MKEFGTESQGPQVVQQVTSLPALTSADLGRIIALVGLRRDLNHGFKSIVSRPWTPATYDNPNEIVSLYGVYYRCLKYNFTRDPRTEPEYYSVITNWWGQSSGAATELYFTYHYMNKPEKVWINGALAQEGTVGSLTSGQWGWGDNETGLDHDTLYIYYAGSDIRSEANDYVQKSEAPQLFIGGVTQWNNLQGEVGSIKFFPTRLLPDGYLEMDASFYLKTTYPLLYAYLKETGSTCIYGEGKVGAGTLYYFNTPDMRGYTVRGWDHDAGQDPDASVRDAYGDLVGDRVGSKQWDELLEHTHTYHEQTQQYTWPYVGANNTVVNTSKAGTTSAEGGSETRMKNINVLAAIKYI